MSTEKGSEMGPSPHNERKSSPKSPSKIDHQSMQEKLKEIESKILEVKLKKMELDGSKPKKLRPREKLPKKGFHHPKLEYIVADIAYSP